MKSPIVVQGCQSILQKLVIITPEHRENWENLNSASFQFSDENSALSVTLPLEEIRDKLDQLSLDAPCLIHGRRTDDYLIANLPRESAKDGLLRLTAIKDGSRAITAKFNFEEIKLAIASLLQGKT